VPVALVNATGVLAGKTIVAIATGGGNHSLALTSDGQVFAWGYNGNGQLGNGTTTSSNVPVAVTTTGALAGKTIVAIAAGYYHSLAVSADGQVFAWGANFDGRLGDGTTTQSNVPVAVDHSGVLSGQTVVAVAAGQAYSLALTATGQVFAWGANDHGQLGDNSTTQRHTPVALVDSNGVLTGKTVIALAAGMSHSLALTSDGRAVGWATTTPANWATTRIVTAWCRWP